MDLFADLESRQQAAHLPLAARMRPRSLDEFVGQKHFLGEGRLLRRMLAANRISSVILYGPPGTGKTTLANLIASHTRSAYVALNAASCGVKEVRTVIEQARDRLALDGKRTLLFLDEIHHFNRTQQDILLPDVESGTVVLIGATTQNPFFALNAPLVSRSQIFEFRPLTQDDIKRLLQRALADKERGFGSLDVHVTEDALDHWCVTCDGDARRALTALEIAVLSLPDNKPIVIDRSVAEDSIQRKAVVYDPTGDEHFDVASAFIKSLRGSDPDAALYWLARMLEAGEDPRFIVRRLIIFASEDIGCADPSALLVATAALQAVEFVGLPEVKLNLAHAVIHLATAPKSNSATAAIGAALRDVAEGRTQPVPAPLRDGHYRGAKRLGRGDAYKNPHAFDGGFVEQPYLTVPSRYYFPTSQGREAAIRDYLAKVWPERFGTDAGTANDSEPNDTTSRDPQTRDMS